MSSVALQPQYPFSAAGTGGSELQRKQYREDAVTEEIARLARSFPSPWSISYELDLDMRQRIRDMLPSRAEAQYLCEEARRHAFWQ